uniref:PID domain-containing protein n=1 Tax=Setaria digitata TaxID=48799 RepID=A0A915PCN1_9BILA
MKKSREKRGKETFEKWTFSGASAPNERLTPLFCVNICACCGSYYNRVETFCKGSERSREETRKGAMVGFQQQRRLREEQQGVEETVQEGATTNGAGSTAAAGQQQQQHGSSASGRANSPRARLAMLKRSSTKCKALSNNDPFRFQGNGVDFKGKLIGVRDVDEARGDAMCAEAMRLAKAAVKSAGHHKQRIILNISIEGLKVKDEKTQTVLHNFPVSRISFIARDTTDARAFGFIYSCSDNKYKFYGIKTTQTADRAVLSIRDMFQIVFEMKKAHLAEVKQKQEEQQNRGEELHIYKTGFDIYEVLFEAYEAPYQKLQEAETADGVRIDNGVAVADLLDLESELHNIEQGYNQLQNIPTFAEDSWPTNDLFATVQPSSPFLPTSTGTVAPLPPPPVSSFAQKNLSDPFDYSSNLRSPPVFSPPAIAPFNTFNAQQPSSLPPTAVWSYLEALAPSTNNRPIAFSETNPFASSLKDDTVARIGIDPFDTKQAQQVLKGSASYNLPATISWSTNENTVPPSGTDPRIFSQWTEKKRVSTLEEAFNKLVDMDTLISSPEIKKNPFSELMNPPKKLSTGAVGSNATVTTPTTMMTGSPHAPCIPARPSAPLVISTTSNNDPFNDEFFN